MSSFFFHTFAATDMITGGVVGMFQSEYHEAIYEIEPRTVVRRCPYEALDTPKPEEKDGVKAQGVDLESRHNMTVWNLAGERVSVTTDYEYEVDGDVRTNIILEPGDKLDLPAVGQQVYTFKSEATAELLLQLIADRGTSRSDRKALHTITACGFDANKSATHVAVFDSRNAALPIWVYASDNDLIKNRPARLVKVDSHPDLSIPRKRWDFQWPRAHSDMDKYTTAQDFVAGAARLDIVGEMDWVKPVWNDIFLDDPIESLPIGDNGSHFFTTHKIEYFGDYVQHPEDETEADKNVDIRTIELGEALDEGSSNASLILDIDLDAFSLENPGTQLLRRRYGVNTSDIETLVHCGCQPKRGKIPDSCQESTNEGEDFKNAIVAFAETIPNRPVGKNLLALTTPLSSTILSKYMPIDQEEPDEDEEAISPTDDRLETYFYDLHEVDEHLCMSPVHYSSSEEIKTGLESLGTTLKSLDRVPGIITLTRSMGGFTPTEQFPEIEEGVFEQLLEAMPNGIRVVYVDNNEEARLYSFGKDSLTPDKFGRPRMLTEVELPPIPDDGPEDEEQDDEDDSDEYPRPSVPEAAVPTADDADDEPLPTIGGDSVATVWKGEAGSGDGDGRSVETEEAVKEIDRKMQAELAADEDAAGDSDKVEGISFMEAPEAVGTLGLSEHLAGIYVPPPAEPVPAIQDDDREDEDNEPDVMLVDPETEERDAKSVAAEAAAGAQKLADEYEELQKADEEAMKKIFGRKPTNIMEEGQGEEGEPSTLQNT